MALVHVSVVCLGSLLLLAPTDPRPEPAVGEGRPQAKAVGGEPPPGAHVIRGGGGVGFGAPHRDDQLHAIREILEPAEEDWKKLAPIVEKVLDAKANMATGAGMNWTRSNNAKPSYKPSSVTPDTWAGAALQAVRDAAADKAAPDQTLIEKMTAVREARKKARAEYEAAEKELIAAVTPRQQALLMTIGLIE